MVISSQRVDLRAWAGQHFGWIVLRHLVYETINFFVRARPPIWVAKSDFVQNDARFRAEFRRKYLVSLFVGGGLARRVLGGQTVFREGRRDRIACSRRLMCGPSGSPGRERCGGVCSQFKKAPDASIEDTSVISWESACGMTYLVLVG